MNLLNASTAPTVIPWARISRALRSYDSELTSVSLTMKFKKLNNGRAGSTIGWTFVLTNTLKANTKWSESSERHSFSFFTKQKRQSSTRLQSYNISLPLSLVIASRQIQDSLCPASLCPFFFLEPLYNPIVYHLLLAAFFSLRRPTWFYYYSSQQSPFMFHVPPPPPC